MVETLRARQKLGKYRIERRIHCGPDACVYAATDTIEAIPVALKIPHAPVSAPSRLEDFRAEVRNTARLEHENILPIKSADVIGDRFVIACPLGQGSLADRLQRRLAVATALSFAEQLLAGLAHAHQRRIIHCDIKPDNLILFPGNRIRITDFGISRLARRTISASGSGTVGYVAPEQALGKPRFASDVFSAAILIYQMLSGERPEWPFRWPLPGIARARRNAPQALIDVLKRGLEVDHRRRYPDAGRMLRAFRRAAPEVERFLERRRRRAAADRGRR